MAALIGIAGHKQAGKTMLAEMLARRLNLTHDSFAAPIREAVARILGISVDALEVRKETPVPWLGGKTPRYLMQTFGTEWGREMIDPDIWVKALIQRVAGEGAVVSDVRFANEAEAIRNSGGRVIRLVRPGFLSHDRHVSETPIPAELVDAELVNDGPAFELVQKALEVLGGQDSDRIPVYPSGDEE
ncbi:hypothetical protein [Luteimonas saliphila]|uniref:deoxynucleotide monophosphate kinase family protein n=1 Tax=Luteimonas saliphila TaxID=2804919 RepID=UPI00192D935C|nr:hypothetical protein [Luteimonas saliphila]